MLRMLQPLILASASPRRQQFLRELGLTFSIVLPEGDEPRPKSGEAPKAYAARTAASKACRVAPACPGAAVLAADTIVVLDGDVLGKPADPVEGLAMLERLSGREHTVITAVQAIFPDGDRAAFTCESRVRFHAWDRRALSAYARTGEPLDKAGGYAVQGIGAFLVASLEGSWTNVVGLPVAEVLELLLARKVVTFSGELFT